MAGRGDGNCGGKCSKNSGWTPVAYYIMYVQIGYIPGSNWKSFRKVEFLINVTNEEQAKIEAEKWIREIRKKDDEWFKLKSAKLVASTHKDILKLTPL